MTIADEGTGQAVQASDDLMKPDPKGGSSVRGRGRPRGASDSGQVGKVLKTVYQQTIEEDIPAEMLDLLRKLD